MCNCKGSGLKLFFTILLGAALASPLAYASDTVEARISACRAIGDAVQRLACFDSIALTPAASPTVPPLPVSHEDAPSPVATSVTAVPASSAKPVAPPPAGPRDGSFGSETVQVKPVDQTKNLTAKAVGVFNGIAKGQKIKLDNGQIWLDVDDHSYDYEATSPDVSITRNFAGNYWMKLSDSSFQFRVRRIQ